MLKISDQENRKVDRVMSIKWSRIIWAALWWSPDAEAIVSQSNLWRSIERMVQSRFAHYFCPRLVSIRFSNTLKLQTLRPRWCCCNSPIAAMHWVWLLHPTSEGTSSLGKQACYHIAYQVMQLLRVHTLGLEIVGVLILRAKLECVITFWWRGKWDECCNVHIKKNL